MNSILRYVSVLIVTGFTSHLPAEENPPSAVPFPLLIEETFSLSPQERLPGEMIILAREVEIQGEVSDDLYLVAGVSSTFSRPSTNAGLARVAGFIRGSLWAAGTRLELTGEVERHLRAAFQNLLLSGRVNGNAWLAGESVVISPEAMIGGTLRAAADRFILRGTVDGHLAVRAREIVLDGTVYGSVSLHAEKILILSGTHVRGTLEVFSSQPVIPAGDAVLEGPFRHVRVQPPNRWALSVLSLASLLLLGLFLAAATPTLMRRPVVLLDRHPWKAMGLGLAALILIPIVAVIAILSLFGLPLGLLLGGLYLFGILSGKIVAAFSLGRLLTGNRGQPLFPLTALPQLVLGLFLFQAAMMFPPPFSSAIWLWFTATGLGGLILALRPAPPDSPPPLPPLLPDEKSTSP
jgi:cytoskeletal protein CcmA (bactofilin family)